MKTKTLLTTCKTKEVSIRVSFRLTKIINMIKKYQIILSKSTAHRIVVKNKK